MGALVYHSNRLEFDDRLLTHLQVVIIHKFRKGEPFVMSWTRSVSAGSGRGSAWMVAASPISFTFFGSRLPSISTDWLQQLSESAESARGLIITNEDGSIAREGAPSSEQSRRAERRVPSGGGLRNASTRYDA